MFNFKKRNEELEQKCDDLIGEKSRLKESMSDLKSEVKQLKQDRKIEEEDIKHMIKMREEAVEVEKQKFEMTCERKKDTEVAAVKDEHRDKLEALLQNQIKDGKELYTEILARLPSINVRMKGDVNG